MLAETKTMSHSRLRTDSEELSVSCSINYTLYNGHSCLSCYVTATVVAAAAPNTLTTKQLSALHSKEITQFCSTNTMLPCELYKTAVTAIKGPSSTAKN